MFSENLFLTNETGKRLYNQYAKDLPIIDYHCHLLPKEISDNKVFEDLGEMWLAHDHYKWRAMRTFGIDENLITGTASYYEKFKAFASIFPMLIGNPMYVWCALELKRYFEIDQPLSSDNADEIYNKTKAYIKEKQMTPQYLINNSKVELVCTTEDPIDTLEYHIKMKNDPSVKTKIISGYRPDKAFYIENDIFTSYIVQLGNCANIKVDSFHSLIKALENRLEFFKSTGTNVSDSGITHIAWEDYTTEEIEDIFTKGSKGESLTTSEVNKFKSAFIINMAKLYYKHDFVMQLHIGTLKNANTKMYSKLGADTGYDCTNDTTSIESVSTILDKLNTMGELPRTILYPLNINQYETFAIVAAAFCGDGIKARVQLGAPWWFNDQVYGINKQFESVANLYPISLSVGMLTDSRSFLSYPRHELYRRVLCNYLGTLIERGEYFSSEADIKKIVENICYFNAKEYFNL